MSATVLINGATVRSWLQCCKFNPKPEPLCAAQTVFDGFTVSVDLTSRGMNFNLFWFCFPRSEPLHGVPFIDDYISTQDQVFQTLNFFHSNLQLVIC